ncbi:Uncharacterised protein [Providencia rettgeri]|uniref:hypothetical protein n=1 Tax=Providencia rettgeri TaxID=587 RepID=UPI001EF450CD|nr:hypothetical protein [Providencia rettgeri]CAB5603144.1 Uncharacterised protein [Providencia rettgeri]CAC9117814.1 Uncharacterised protein [Providencia rettgeri]CAC9131161.1 Uncharacterised protein [Providencia rettgeri]
MNAYAMKDVQEERRLENAAWQDAEKRRKEREEEAEYYRMESLGIQSQSTPDRWMRGEYG